MAEVTFRWLRLAAPITISNQTHRILQQPHSYSDHLGRLNTEGPLYAKQHMPSLLSSRASAHPVGAYHCRLLSVPIPCCR